MTKPAVPDTEHSYPPCEFHSGRAVPSPLFQDGRYSGPRKVEVALLKNPLSRSEDEMLGRVQHVRWIERRKSSLDAALVRWRACRPLG